MHPAFSVIFFTTASGAGYGLLALLALFGVTGLLPTDTWLGFVAFAVSLGLIVGPDHDVAVGVAKSGMKHTLARAYRHVRQARDNIGIIRMKQ